MHTAHTHRHFFVLRPDAVPSHNMHTTHTHTHTHTHTQTHTHTHTPHTHTHTHNGETCRPDAVHTQHTRSTHINTDTNTTERQGDQKVSTYRNFFLHGKVFSTDIRNYFLDREARRPEGVHLSLMINLKP